MVEAALLAPWIFLLFIGTFDFGFFIYATICVQNAARVAAMANALSGNQLDQATACAMVLQEMNSLPNVTLSTTCTTSLAVTDANPVAVVLGPNALPPVTTGPDGQTVAKVTVRYLSVQLFPIPGLMGKMTMTRSAEVPYLNP
jgi:Flp pilus assembly protein TadG